jgi:hypothetical protein
MFSVEAELTRQAKPYKWRASPVSSASDFRRERPHYVRNQDTGQSVRIFESHARADLRTQRQRS